MMWLFVESEAGGAISGRDIEAVRPAAYFSR
jgi:hypothetical protein